jgi:hypothetical protein
MPAKGDLKEPNDQVTIDPRAAIERHVKLAHRATLILEVLEEAGIPFSRFTHEALVMVTEAVDFSLAEIEVD